MRKVFWVEFWTPWLPASFPEATLRWLVVSRTTAQQLVGLTTRDPHKENVWNIWWIGVSPIHHGEGAGQVMLSHVEQAVAALGARVIVVETIDQPPLARAQKFYLKLGYEERGRIPDFYGKGDSKVIFSRSIAGEPNHRLQRTAARRR